MKRLVAIFCMAALSIMLLSPVFGAVENRSASNAQPNAERIKPTQMPMSMDKSIAFISGSISNIDATSPESVKLEVLNDVTGKSHVIEIGMGTNILKVVEIGELKVGDKARIVARQSDGKEMALSVVTGKLKEMQMLKPPAPAQVTAPAAKEGQTKK